MASTTRVHLLWVIGILIAIILVLITVKWGAIDDLVGYVSFALTLTSLVLALLAIVYAFHSNSAFSQHATSLDRAADRVTNTAEDFKTAAQQLTKDLQEIPPRLDTVIGEVQTAKELLQRKDVPEPKLPEPRAHVNDLFAKVFVRVSSIMGLLAVIACAKSYSTKKSFTLHDLTNSVKLLNENYSYGFLMATIGSGLLDFNMNKEIITVKFVYENLMIFAEDEIKRSSQKDEEIREHVEASLKEIEDYFGA